MKPLFHQRTEYLRFWGLQVSPFLQRDQKRFFCGTVQRNVLIQVEQFIASGENVALVVGEAGSGMTRVFQYLEQLSGLGDCAVEMLSASELPTAGESVRTVWLRDRIHPIRGCWPKKLPSNLSVLIGTESSDQESLIATLGKYPRVIEMAKMTIEDCFSYVSFSLRMAGAGPAIFTDSAIIRLHEYSSGRIREFSQLAENALRESWSQKQPTIGPNLIDQLGVSRRYAA